MTSRNPLTLSRQELYDLVWSKPVTEVAKELGLSDVAVAKRCRQVQVPVPPRGYWARVSAGQTPRRIPLPKFRDGSNGRGRTRASSILSTIHADESHPESVKREHPGAEAHAEPTVTFHLKGPEEQARKSEAEAASGPKSPHRAALDAQLSALPHPADAPESWVVMDDNTVSPPGWPENLRTEARLPVITVHAKTSMLRARRMTTQLIHVITQLGWRFNPKPPEPEPTHYRRSYETPEEAGRRAAHFLIEEERLFISITERRTRTERPLTPEEQRERRRNPNGYFYYRDRYTYHPSGELTLHVSTSTGSGGFASFRDTKRNPLETRITDIVRCLLQGALDIKERCKAAAEAAERRRQDEERRERIRKTREAHAHLISRLEAEAGAWGRAQRLRRYLRAARRALSPGARLNVVLEGASVDLLALGEAFADQLDPLHPSLRAREFFDKTDPYASGERYESDETKVHKFITRVLGGDWPHVPKMTGSDPGQDTPRSAGDFLESLLEDS